MIKHRNKFNLGKRYTLQGEKHRQRYTDGSKTVDISNKQRQKIAKPHIRRKIYNDRKASLLYIRCLFENNGGNSVPKNLYRWMMSVVTGAITFDSKKRRRNTVTWTQTVPRGFVILACYFGAFQSTLT